MTLPAPFAYPSRPHQRKHGPMGYEPYGRFKNWVRDEFAFRCVYCLGREMWYPDRWRAFSIDHVEPQATNPGRIGDYDNMVYACLRCNAARRDVAVIDPTRTAFGDHLRVGPDGVVEALSHEGGELIELLHLNDAETVANRRELLDIIELHRDYPDDPRVRALFLRKFGYPRVLPNLARYRPPRGNARPDGVRSCYFMRRAAGTLEEIYSV